MPWKIPSPLSCFSSFLPLSKIFPAYRKLFHFLFKKTTGGPYLLTERFCPFTLSTATFLHNFIPSVGFYIYYLFCFFFFLSFFFQFPLFFILLIPLQFSLNFYVLLMVSFCFLTLIIKYSFLYSVKTK